MKLRDFPRLADQNIHADVVAFLRAEGGWPSWTWRTPR